MTTFNHHLVVNASTMLCVSASRSTLARLECRWALPVGSCTASSTASSLLVRCPKTRQLAAVTTPSIPSSLKQRLASMYPEQYSWIWSRLLWLNCHIFNFTAQDEVRTGVYYQLFHPKQLITAKEDGGNVNA
ncbi:hypothetical protein FHG87_021556 [Trinorchestia longiramus]|nr:hypothetical protein FHG87_021556 [Trinorchestia longiramus]